METDNGKSVSPKWVPADCPGAIRYNWPSFAYINTIYSAKGLILKFQLLELYECETTPHISCYITKTSEEQVAL